jgi:hypothetical protein
MNITSIITTIAVMLAVGLIYSLGMVIMNKTFYRKKEDYFGADCLSSGGACSSCGITGCSINPARTEKTEE